MGSFWPTILSDYLEKIIRGRSTADSAGQKTTKESVDLALVISNTHGPYSHCAIQQSGWMKDVDGYMQWLNSIPFFGGGFNEAAISEGLAEALSASFARSMARHGFDMVLASVHALVKHPPLPKNMIWKVNSWKG